MITLTYIQLSWLLTAAMLVGIAIGAFVSYCAFKKIMQETLGEFFNMNGRGK